MAYFREPAGGLIGRKQVSLFQEADARAAAAEPYIAAAEAVFKVFNPGQAPSFKPGGVPPDIGEPPPGQISQFDRQLQTGVKIPNRVHGAHIAAGAAKEVKG